MHGWEDGLLEQDLTVDYREFFHAFGYSDSDLVFLRTIHDKERDAPATNKQIELSRFDAIIPSLKKANASDCGVFFVVNGDAHEDKQVRHSRASFIDIDDFSFEEQVKSLAEFALEPSIVIKTRKSLHAYWLTPGGDIKYFRELQSRLIQHFKSDKTIINESRVMRLPGFNHCKQDPLRVRLLKFDPDVTYSQRELHEALPRLAAAPVQKPVPIQNGELVKYGERHRYVVSRCGYYTAKIGDAAEAEAILELVCTDFLANCEQDPPVDMVQFRRKYLHTIEKFKTVASDPDVYSKAAQHWQRTHPEQDFKALGISWDTVKQEYLLSLEVEDKKPKRDKPSGALKWTTFATIEKREVEWLIPGYVPRKGITILGGDGGTGKSAIECSIAAAISTGKPTFLLETPYDCKPGRVVMLNAEDPYSEVLKPLLTVNNANQENVIALDEKQIKEEGLAYSDDRLKEAIKEFKPDLIIFDPIQQFLPEQVHMAERNAMRREMSHAMAMAAENNCAVLICMHTNKKQGVYGRQRLADSADIWDIARSVLMAGVGDDGSVHVTHEKSNFAKLQDSVVFTFDDDRRINVIERNTKRDRDYMVDRTERKSGMNATDEAIESICSYLGGGKEVCVGELDDAMIALGISKNALKNAKKGLKDSKKLIFKPMGKGKGGGVQWRVSLSKAMDVHDLTLPEC